MTSIYRQMDDATLARVIAALEAKLAAVQYARAPALERMRQGYIDALTAARAERERRAV